MMNSEIYFEELSDAIDNAIEDEDWASYGDFAEDTWTDEADWYCVESALFGDC